jgi:hypothetical protein
MKHPISVSIKPAAAQAVPTMGVEGLELLVQIRERLLQIANRLTNIQVGRGAHVVNLMTLREFTESIY